MANQTGLGWALELLLLLQPLRGSGRQISVTSAPTLFYIRSFRPASQGHTVRLCFKRGRKGEREGGKKGVRKPSGFSRSRSPTMALADFSRSPLPHSSCCGSFVPIAPTPPLGSSPGKISSALPSVFLQLLHTGPRINASHARCFSLPGLNGGLKGHIKDIVCGAPHPRDS